MGRKKWYLEVYDENVNTCLKSLHIFSTEYVKETQYNSDNNWFLKCVKTDQRINQ